jgi:hypothetical protein
MTKMFREKNESQGNDGFGVSAKLLAIHNSHTSAHLLVATRALPTIMGRYN